MDDHHDDPANANDPAAPHVGDPDDGTGPVGDGHRHTATTAGGAGDSGSATPEEPVAAPPTNVAKWFAGGAAAGGIAGLAAGALVGLLIGLAVGIPLDDPNDTKVRRDPIEAPAPADEFDAELRERIEERIRDLLDDERLQDGLEGFDGGQSGRGGN
jgi:hypothetical protein